MEIRIAEIAALAVVVLSAAAGACRGLVMTVYSLVRFILLLILAVLLVPILRPVIPAEVLVPEGAAFVLAFILAFVLLGIVAHLLKIVDHIPVLRTVNKLGGFLVGAVFGVIAVWLALFVIGCFQDAPWCRTLAEYVHESPVLMEIQRVNPLVYVMEFFS